LTHTIYIHNHYTMLNTSVWQLHKIVQIFCNEIYQPKVHPHHIYYVFIRHMHINSEYIVTKTQVQNSIVIIIVQFVVNCKIQIR